MDRDLRAATRARETAELMIDAQLRKKPRK
jgi:hypothetical protein